MKAYQQRLIVFILFITALYAKPKIEYFDAQAPTDIIGTHSTIYDTHIELWANVAACPSTDCGCFIKTDQLDDDPNPLVFLKDPKSHVGYARIIGLQPNTLYKFTLTCKDKDGQITETKDFKTDYGRPSTPNSILASLENEALKISWSLITPVESLSYYRITIDNDIVSNITDLKVDSYKTSKKYVYGVAHKIQVQACYINKQTNAICSQPKVIDFFEPTKPTPTTVTPAPVTLSPTLPSSSTTTTTTTQKSTGAYSCSVSIFMIICSLVFLS